MKRLITLFLLLLLVTPVLAQANNTVNVYFFWANGCPHCSSEKPFLESLENKYDNVIIHSFEVTSSSENAELLRSVGEELGVIVRGVPFTVVGEQYFSPFLDEYYFRAGIQIDNITIGYEHLCTHPVVPWSGQTVPIFGGYDRFFIRVGSR